MKQKLTSRILKYLLITSAVIAVAYALIWVALQGYSAPWTGFGDFTKPSGEFVRGKTLWDWMQLFIIPIFLSVGVFFLNRSERENERDIATDRQREAALQTYLDRMADLILKEKLQTSRKKEVRNVARTRTLTVLRGLDETRKGFVLQFLQEATLLDKEVPTVDLSGADLRHTTLQHANLSGVNLSSADLRNARLWGTDLSHATLKDTNLDEANLFNVNLRFANLANAGLFGTYLGNAKLSNANLLSARLQGANLHHADLSSANLSSANLLEAKLQFAELNGATLRLARLESADLKYANLSDADLSQANLYQAKVTNEQLAQAKSLKGTIMPDGTKHD